MIPEPLPIRKSLNKAYLKVKPVRSHIELFKSNISELYNHINISESEEHHKNIIAGFLRNTYYEPDHYINTKGRTDLVIHNGKNSQSSVGVIIETKRPGNKAEMPSGENLNAKAVHELLLYYLRERITGKNLELKHLIVTDLNEWFIFNAQEFEKLFASSKKLVKDFEQFEEHALSGTKTDFFYNEIAKPFIENLDKAIQFTWFDLSEFRNIISNTDKKDDAKLIGLYKIFSPEHLLKLPFSNDSNTLDRRFYNELLHIIGLEETKEGGKKLIGRKAEKTRNPDSLLENTINILKHEDSLNQLSKPSEYGSNKEEQLFSVALELCITWINRILFLKLLEGQLIRYHKGDEKYKFLNPSLIADFDILNKLFFHVLAVEEKERNERIRQVFGNIPYLNSSLFEPSDLEHKTVRISNLDDNGKLPVLSSTVLKDNLGSKVKGEENTLYYLLKFLDAYDFSSEGKEEISEENKTLINASVLGLIFEKINGYKDGSFFTPGFITMYMCRETIRRAVVQKFNEAKGLKCDNIEEVYNYIEDKAVANSLINSLKICDPAVGSGHFLVSALNEIIAIKSELKILADKKGKVLRDYHVEVINDELVITDEDGEFFEYHPKNPESQRIQETLFHEKQTIIENCLFGVDINPNSVKICRLRLWIELLKNAYYKPESGFTELETLPNIDINIKCGNSLISRYPLDADIKKALQRSKWSIDSYRAAVMTYRNAENKEEKASMRKLIEQIKNDFESEVALSDKRFIRLNKLKGELTTLTSQTSLFALSQKEKDEWNKKVKKITDEITKIENELEEIKNNKIYEHAFEWRFEFPEVLNDDGEFVGFDVVIGNPPYIPLESYNLSERIFFSNKFNKLERKYDSSVMFFIEGITKLKPLGLLTYIAPITWQTGENYSILRKWLFEKKGINEIINLPFNIFEDAYVETAIYSLINGSTNNYKIYCFDKKAKNINLNNFTYSIIQNELILPDKYKIILNPIANRIIKRLDLDGFKKLGEITISTQGLSGGRFIKSELCDNNSYPFLSKGNVYNYQLIKEKTFLTSLSDHQTLKQFYEANPKILIRRIINRQNRLSVGYTEEKLVFKKDINPFIPMDKDFSAKYILSILASKLISYLYINLSSIATKDDFRQTTLSELRDLLIPKISIVQQQFFIELAEKIMHYKKQDPLSDTFNFEMQIDQMVYHLFGLTEEEIKIVEEAVK